MSNIALFICFLSSFGVGLAIVLSKPLHSKFTADDTKGDQKFHSGIIPRVGGLTLIAGMLSSTVWPNSPALLPLILISLIPVFLFGFWEDLFKSVSSLKRLLASLSSAAMIVAFTGFNFSAVDVYLLDHLISNDFIWVVLTIIALAALSNGLNIIDGFNGLAAGSSVSMALGIAFLAYISDDFLVLNIALVFAASLFGFLLLNFPKGYIFLGDAGAYTSGLTLGTLGMILVEKNDDITPLTLMIVFAYPIVELLFSFYRKTVRKGHRPDLPDRVHFHMLVYRSFGRRFFRSQVARNSFTGACLNFLSFSGLICVLLFPVSRALALSYFLLFFIIYVHLYRKMTFR